MLIKSPGDRHGARAQGIGTESPQGRLFAPRGLGEESPTPRFSRGDAPKLVSSFKYKVSRFRTTNYEYGGRFLV